MSKKVVMSEHELNEIQVRVERVKAHLSESTAAWLAIAEEFASAKTKLKRHAFEKFANDCGFTTSVADKLVKIGACTVLHSAESLPLVSSAEGWTVLYELSKLDTKQIDNLLDVVANDNKKLTRELIHNFVNNKPLDAKRLIVASIEVDERKLQSMSYEQFSKVQSVIYSLAAEIDRINAGFALKSRKSNMIVIATRAKANSDALILATAA